MSLKEKLQQNWTKLVAALLVAGSIVVPVSSVVASTTSQPRNNDANAIMWGGAYSKTEWLGKVEHGDGHNSAANLQQIYYKEGRGITQANFTAGYTVPGTVFKDGRVEVNGKVVATGAEGIGRSFIAGSHKSGSVWERPTSASFLDNSLSAWVDMQGNTFHYAILNACGNVISAKPVPQPTPTPSPTPKPTPTPSHTPSPTPTRTPSPTPTPTRTPSPTPTPSRTPSPTPTPSATPSETPTPSEMPSPSASPLIFKCVDIIRTRPDINNKTQFRFTIDEAHSPNVTVTGFRFSFSDNSPVVDTPADTPFIERNLGPGSLTVFGQVKTDAGISAVSDKCSVTATVAAQTPSPTPTPSNTPSPTPTPSPSPSPTPVVLSASLPATGPETALGGVAGLTAIGFAGRAYIRSRKTLLESLRHKRTK